MAGRDVDGPASLPFDDAVTDDRGRGVLAGQPDMDAVSGHCLGSSFGERAGPEPPVITNHHATISEVVHLEVFSKALRHSTDVVEGVVLSDPGPPAIPCRI